MTFILKLYFLEGEGALIFQLYKIKQEYLNHLHYKLQSFYTCVIFSKVLSLGPLAFSN